MTQIHTPEVYVVRIPVSLQPALQELEIPFYELADLAKLSTKLALEDVFYFVYEQTASESFVQFVTDGKLQTILQHPSNIAWLGSVKTQFDKYIEQKEHQVKNQSDSGLTQKPFWIDHSPILETRSNLCPLLIEVFQYDHDLNSMNPRNEFNFLFLESFVKASGFAAAHNHPVMKSLLSFE